MNYHLIKADSKELRDLGAKLPVGRIFPASGKAFMPFVKAALFDRLTSATGAPDTPMATSGVLKAAEGGVIAGGGPGARGRWRGRYLPAYASKQAPADWSQINIGSFVLAQGDEGDDGYYAAKVISMGTDDKFSLIWVNYPEPREVDTPSQNTGATAPRSGGHTGLRLRLATAFVQRAAACWNFTAAA